MSKRNIVFNKPEDPSFLKRIKESIGYREGPTVETKRQRLEHFEESDSDSEVNEEKPQVVVLKPGDLTADEAEREQQKLLKEEAEKPADLSQRIIFKGSKSKSSTSGKDKDSEHSKGDKKKAEKPKLSFNEEEEDEESV
ncbi:uncharacterized protein KIAA1143 homolog [Phlebotomus argentipes]|uniref:uncharacterized protein KIAA1143 homolog n=1 Tax=Phlebotomus argentipes TaxID=94469 RepID=UPI002892E441|nr:uncharacterized protein KIAA1143 homolog [Phlebotomus argentipes]